MNSLAGKADATLLARLSDAAPAELVPIEIVPRRGAWRALLAQLRSKALSGVSYNVIDMTSISACVPAGLVESIARREDVEALRLLPDQPDQMEVEGEDAAHPKDGGGTDA